MSQKESADDERADDSLVAGFLAGDPHCLSKIRSWIRTATRAYRKRLRDDFDDLEQDVLVGLTVALRNSRFRGECSLQTYVRTLAHHKCIDQIRSVRRGWLPLGETDLPSLDPLQAEELASKEAAWLTLKVLNRVPEPCLELWRLIGRGLSYREICQRLNVSEGALRVRALRCRKQARKIREQLLEEPSAARPQSD